MQKIAVFDLDGTLCEYNTLFESVREMGGYKPYFDSFAVKLADKFFPIRRALYVGAYDVQSEPSLEFRNSALSLLEKARGDGYRIVIMSAAPSGILQSAANRLGAEYVCCKPGKKQDELYRFMPYSRLMVCTDNQSDSRLLDLADERVIYYTSRNHDFFRRRYKNAAFLEK